MTDSRSLVSVAASGRLPRLARLAALLGVVGGCVGLASAEPGLASEPGVATDPALSPATAAAAAAAAAPAAKAPDFPPFEKAIEGLTKVVSTADGATPLYDLYRDDKTGKLLAVLPANFESQLMMIACTVTAGDSEAGVMGPTHYTKWERYDKQLALISPDFSVRTSSDDKQLKDSVSQLYTGRVITTVPIVSMAPGNRPVIDLGAMATRDVSKFFGSSVYGGYGPNLPAVNPALTKLTKAKTFPKNVVIEYQAPRPDGQLVRFAYSIGELTGTPGFKPRKASPKTGYFYDFYQDFGKTSNKDITERYINRWSLEKADPKLKVSPPKEPIVWYIEHTTPLRFRRYVREGIEMWNQAFSEIGFDNAVVVYQQDATTGANMDKDPEDSRYNFFRWNASDNGYAIGPSRTNPLTGEILDADVVWHQGLTRAVRSMVENFSLAIAEHAFSPETLQWLEEQPTWDPRLRLVGPDQREAVLRERAMRAANPEQAKAAGRSEWALASMAGGGACRIGTMLSLDMGLADAAFASGAVTPKSPDTLDDLPEEYLGQMIRYISAHEVGHCLGLQHNMISSTIRSLKEINSTSFSGATVGSVMEYAAANINYNLGDVQGPYATPVLGPYDKWVIAYGYGPEDKLPELLKKSGEPDLIYQAQSAITFDADPRNNTWDLGADNLQFAESRLGLIKEVRAKLLDKIVKEGESWAVARRRYTATLNSQLQMLSIASRWIGGSFLNNDSKGDPGDRAPISDVPAESQRRALKLIIDNAFEDSSFGLTPEIVRYLNKEHFYDNNEIISDSSFTVHDSLGGVQSVALTMIMNPTRLRRLYDNEFRTAGTDNMITMNEVVRTVTDNVWREYAKPSGSFSDKSPMASSLRRNLQREHLERLVTLSLLRDSGSASIRAISSIARLELKRVDGLAEGALKASPDAYTKAHLDDARTRIAKTLEASYVVTR
ncbi:MAG TPA: zinc-dependent metalloprotease [Phycisphaerales bacterium]